VSGIGSGPSGKKRPKRGGGDTKNVDKLGGHGEIVAFRSTKESNIANF
jgi:hypothetical protein